MLTVQVVVNPVRTSAERWRDEWVPWYHFKADRGSLDWMLHSLFNRSIRFCNITTSSVIEVLLLFHGRGRTTLKVS